MKVKQIFDAITEVRDEYIEEARTTQLKKSAIAWKKWTMIVAACIVMAIGIRGAYSLPDLLPFGGKAGGSGSGHGESSTFMSYAGPAFPLTLSQPDNTVTATRNIIYDFSLPYEDSIRVWGANVEDRYTLINSSTEEKNIEAVYPFVGSFNDLKELIPTITVNGQKEHPALYAGGYSGGEKLDSWEGYKALLEDGSYQSNAFAADPVLSQPVTVYAFTDFEAPLEYEAATQAISFNIDPDKTTILHYGFNGIDIGDNGFRRYSYFVPKDIRMEKDIKLLIIIGEDIKDYSLQGYKNGACERGNELEGVSSTVTRKEQILSDVMGEVINHFFTNYDDGNSLAVSQEMFLGAVTEFMVHYGLLSDNARDHYQYGVLEDVILETYSLKRVFYLKFQVSVPVGESVLVTVKMRKNPSYDFICSGTDNKGIQGYDMVTRLGSNLHFDALTAELTSTQNIEIVRQNYGFNLSQGVTEVELDLNNEHYYLEIRPVEQ